jgi:uncharacterized UPF0160 family protein
MQVEQLVEQLCMKEGTPEYQEAVEILHGIDLDVLETILDSLVAEAEENQEDEAFMALAEHAMKTINEVVEKRCTYDAMDENWEQSIQQAEERGGNYWEFETYTIH